MSKTIRNFVVILNLIIILLSIYWYKNPNSNIEPITVFVSQLISLLALFFGDKIVAIFHINEVSNSEIEIDAKADDNSEYKISKIKDASKIKIKKH